jgi:hypothetical protein
VPTQNPIITIPIREAALYVFTASCIHIGETSTHYSPNYCDRKCTTAVPVFAEIISFPCPGTLSLYTAVTAYSLKKYIPYLSRRCYVRVLHLLYLRKCTNSATNQRTRSPLILRRGKIQRIQRTLCSLCLSSMPIPVAARSKSLVCGRALAGIVGSNPTRGMDVCLVQYLCCQVEVSATGRSLVQRSPTDCGVCLSVIK